MIFSVRQANIDDISNLSVLFNQYRLFYQKKDDLSLAHDFLSKRLINKDSMIFIAEIENGGLAGFLQLYPTFSSLSAKSAWILNDLFVNQNVRKCGVASALMHQALDFCKTTDATWVYLQTAADNIKAQALYRKFNFILENNFLTMYHSL